MLRATMSSLGLAMSRHSPARGRSCWLAARPTGCTAPVLSTRSKSSRSDIASNLPDQRLKKSSLTHHGKRGRATNTGADGLFRPPSRPRRPPGRRRDDRREPREGALADVRGRLAHRAVRVAGARARSAAAPRRPRRRRKDRPRARARRDARPAAGPPPVLRGPRRGEGPLRVGLRQADALHAAPPRLGRRADVRRRERRRRRRSARGGRKRVLR